MTTTVPSADRRDHRDPAPTAERGRRRRRAPRIRRTGALAVTTAVATGALVGLTAGAAFADCGGPDGSCIGTVTTTKAGSGFTVGSTTTVPTTAKLVVSDTGSTSDVDGTAKDTTLRVTHKLKVDGLKPNTAYTYRYSVTDTGGHTKTAIGKVTTLHRRLILTLTSIYVDDDSDDLSAGDMFVSWKAGGIVDPLFWQDKSIASGQTVHPNRTLIVWDKASAAVAVEMLDDDCDPWDFCTNGLGPDWSKGSTAYADWNTAKGTVNGAGTVKISTTGPIDFTATIKTTVDFT